MFLSPCQGFLVQKGRRGQISRSSPNEEWPLVGKEVSNTVSALKSGNFPEP